MFDLASWKAIKVTPGVDGWGGGEGLRAHHTQIRSPKVKRASEGKETLEVYSLSKKIIWGIVNILDDCSGEFNYQEGVSNYCCNLSL